MHGNQCNVDNFGKCVSDFEACLHYENMGSPRGKRAGSKECKAAHSTRIPKDYTLLFSFIACTA